jgi:hypothetical protein
LRSSFLAIGIFGILLLLAGTVFAFQGYGSIKGSVMTGNPFWIYAGAGIAVLGLILIGLGFGLGARRTKSPGMQEETVSSPEKSSDGSQKSEP